MVSCTCVGSSDPYTLTLENRRRYLYACVEAGSINLEVSLRYANRVMTHLQREGHSRMIFVRDVPTLTSRDEHSMVINLILNMLPKHVRAALVDRSATHKAVAATINEQAEQKGRNIRAFEALDEAESWLLTGLADTQNSEPASINTCDSCVTVLRRPRVASFGDAHAERH